ncbi:dehydrogenase/reductase SDR family member 11-like [Diadema setosum]|uniref:dehydrogenase/reductase SDR family member 11-like n=1 Tax=Diadema setosum TaxID=31175 RepID=UPI003B3B3669
MNRWIGRVALVTGASAGIGAAITKDLARQGMQVVASARSLDKLVTLRKEVESESWKGSVAPKQCDLSNSAEVEGMFSWIKEKFGGVDVCVNNAGYISPDCTLLDGQPSEWRKMLEVNILALTACSNLSIKHMMSRSVDDGHIINIGSLLCHRVVGGRYAKMRFQAAIKHMTAALTEGLRQELRERNSNIRVSLVSPSGVDTSIRSLLCEDLTNEGQNNSERTQLINVQEVADVVVSVLRQKPHLEVHEVFFRPTSQKD